MELEASCIKENDDEEETNMVVIPVSGHWKPEVIKEQDLEKQF